MQTRHALSMAPVVQIGARLVSGHARGWGLPDAHPCSLCTGPDDCLLVTFQGYSCAPCIHTSVPCSQVILTILYSFFVKPTRVHVFTETKQQSPNTGARAHNTLHK